MGRLVLVLAVVAVVVWVLVSMGVLSLAPLFSLGRSGYSVPQVERLAQADPAQYASPQEYQQWWPSDCSAAVMAEVMNAYGAHYRITDVLRVEAAFQNPQVLTADAGLLYLGGIDRTVRAFGYQATWLDHHSVDTLVTRAQQTPIIVNFPPDRFAGGHFVVVTGGSASQVALVDSSTRNHGQGMHTLARQAFLDDWNGSAVVVRPLHVGGN